MTYEMCRSADEGGGHSSSFFFFFFKKPAPPESSPFPLPAPLPFFPGRAGGWVGPPPPPPAPRGRGGAGEPPVVADDGLDGRRDRNRDERPEDPEQRPPDQDRDD